MMDDAKADVLRDDTNRAGNQYRRPLVKVTLLVADREFRGPCRRLVSHLFSTTKARTFTAHRTMFKLPGPADTGLGASDAGIPLNMQSMSKAILF